jgi:penicillin-binding protein 1C
MVSPQDFHRQLVAAGVPLQQAGDHYGYSLALGSAEVPLLGLANGYRTLANLGRHGDVRWLPAAKGAPRPSGRQAIDARAAFIVGDILSDTNARARTFGTDSLLATRFWSAVKTGTSKDMRDNWAVGWSQRYTVGVWIGNASGAPMHDVSGTSGAAPVWAALMGYLHAREPSRAPAPPAGLVRQQVRFGDRLEAQRSEWFLAGTQQDTMALDAAGGRGSPAVATRITAPADGTILALDPDIPPQRQRLALRAEGGGALQWRVDGKPLARGAQAAWLPWPGRHVLQLVNGAGQVVDEVRVEVRGAGVKAR